MNQFELKNVKIHADMSEETTCFSATAYWNGKKIGYVKNEGRGGSHMWHFPRKEAQEIDAYLATLPKYKLCDELPMQQPDVEWLIDQVLLRHQCTKELKRVVDSPNKAALLGNDGRIYTLSFNQTSAKRMLDPATDRMARRASLLLHLTHNKEAILKKHDAKEILNLLPFEEALDLYVKGTM